jgi:tetratricopeptide (TPR) repeat protein
MAERFGPDNDNTAMVLNNMARLYIQQQKYAEAENLCSRALDTLENIFDENHPCVAEVLETMVQLQQRVGNTAEAAKLEARVEQIRELRQVAYEPVAKAIE